MTQIEIKALEQRYKFYKLRYFLLRISLIFVILALILSLYIFYEYKKEQKMQLKLAQEQKNQMLQRLEKAKTEAKKAEFLIQTKENENLQAKKEFKIKIKSYALNLKTLEKNFQNKADFKIALELAKLYFLNKEYEKASTWALKANELANEDKEAWLIFAKIKKAQGNDDEARKILEAYIHFYGEAENLKDL